MAIGLGICAAGAALLAAVEGGARAALAMRRRLLRRLPPLGQLHPYQMRDPLRPASWRLVPGYQRTLDEAIAAATRRGRTKGAQLLVEEAARLGATGDDVLFKVNAHGFKGPDLRAVAPGRRVLMLGDSCTFGTPFDAYCVPRSLERRLHELGHDVEVVNAGEPGYVPAQVLARLDEYLQLRPDLTLVWLGWMGIFHERTGKQIHASPLRRALSSLERGSTAFRLARGAIARARASWRATHAAGPHGTGNAVPAQAPAAVPLAGRSATREGGEPRPDPHARELARIATLRPWFARDVARLVRGLRRGGGHVALLTLPCLFRTGEPPSSVDLERGHLPAYTDNPYVLAAITERYNSCLRQIANREGAGVIDLGAWGDQALFPREAHFVDSLHVYARSQERIGHHLAHAVLPYLRTSRTPGG